MSEYFNKIKGILESNGESYESKYPKIREKNVYSISTLAHGATAQIYWKMKGQKGQFPYESNVGKAFFLGRAQHEFIQNRMKECLSEYSLEYTTPNFTLVGHIDLLDLKNEYVLEIKTTSMVNIIPSRMKEYLLQVGTYAKLMSLQTGREYNASVFVINGTLTEYALTKEDIDNSFKVILQRAEDCYQELVKRRIIAPEGEIK